MIKNNTPQKDSSKYLDIHRYCEYNAIKLTPLRQQILFILKDNNQPMTAYAVLDELKKDSPKAQVMSVYRVLDYLLKNRLIHRIENLNAFMSCCHLFKHHLSQWLICTQCSDAKEYALPIFNQSIKKIEKQTGFSVTTPTIELMGLCKNCMLTRGSII